MDPTMLLLDYVQTNETHVPGNFIIMFPSHKTCEKAWRDENIRAHFNDKAMGQLHELFWKVWPRLRIHLMQDNARRRRVSRPRPINTTEAPARRKRGSYLFVRPAEPLPASARPRPII